MIITHTTSADGRRRVYLGGKASLECWIEPLEDGTTWRLQADDSAAGSVLPTEQKRAWIVHLLLALADELGVAPSDLKAVPFENIAALHTSNPLEHRRIAMPRRQVMDHGFMATAPNITRPRADFNAADFAQYARKP